MLFCLMQAGFVHLASARAEVPRPGAPLLCLSQWSKEPRGPSGRTSPLTRRPCAGHQDLRLLGRRVLSCSGRLCTLPGLVLPSAHPWGCAALALRVELGTGRGSRWTYSLHCPHASDREWRKRWERRQGRPGPGECLGAKSPELGLGFQGSWQATEKIFGIITEQNCVLH